MNGLNTGKYTWCINDIQLIRSMKSMKSGEKCQTPTFEMAGIKWVIMLFPNSTEEKFKGKPLIRLKPLFNDEWSKLVFIRSIHCAQDGTSTMLSSISNEEVSQYPILCSVNELSQQQNITINVSVNIIKIITKQSSTTVSR
eukprot:376690_1